MRKALFIAAALALAVTAVFFQACDNLLEVSAVTGRAAAEEEYDENVCTITYYVNGGAGSAPAAQTVAKGENLALQLGLGMWKDGYTFAGWNDNKESKGTVYSPGGVYRVSLSLKLYAMWEVTAERNNNIYVINYNSNKPDNASSTLIGQMEPSFHKVDKAHPEKVTKSLTANGYALASWNFEGWLGPDGRKYTDRQQVANLAEPGTTITFYAQWRPLQYTVTYNAEGGSVSGISATVSYDSSFTLAKPALTGYNFIGW